MANSAPGAQFKRDIAGNILGLDGLEVGLPTNALIEDNFRQVTTQAFIKTTPTVVETIPTSNLATQYYIDPIAGVNTNNGTSPSTPWADLHKVMGLALGPGAVVNIAADAVFDYSQPFATYKTRALFPYNGMDSVRGSSTQPVIFKPYTVRASSTQKKPLIRWYGSIGTGDWTQESGIGPNVWSVAWNVSGFNNDYSAFLMYGPDKSFGIAPRAGVSGQPTGNVPQQLAKNKDYAFDSGKLYVYSSGGNPTTYFNGVYIAAYPVFASYWQGMHQTKFTGLRFEYTAAIIIGHTSSVQNGVQGVEIANCEYYRAYPGYFDSSGTAASASEMSISIHDNLILESPMQGFKLGYGGGTAGNTLSWEVYRNRIYGGNLCSSSGGALLYNQSTGGTKHIAWGNYGYDCRNGTGNSNNDGAFIYQELSSKNSTTYGNIAERCGIPYQLNNALNCIFVSNVAIDCPVLLQITGTGDVSTANQSYVVAHNTWVWTGRVDADTIPRGPGAPTLANGAVIREWNDNFPTFGNKFTNLVLANNLAVSAVPLVNKPLLTYISSQITSLFISGNAAAGLSTVLVKDNGTDTSKNVGFIVSAGSHTDASSWIKNVATGGSKVTSDSPLAGMGTPISIQYQDITGKNFGARPTPGCYEPQ